MTVIMMYNIVRTVMTIMMTTAAVLVAVTKLSLMLMTVPMVAAVFVPVA